jgi:cyclohexanecarboxyl-CoA dehydrogenase
MPSLSSPPCPSPYEDEAARAIAETARRFATERIAPGYLERERTGRLDRELAREMGALGLIAPELPEEAGGLGVSTVAAGLILEAIAAADLSFAYVNLLASLCGAILARHGQPEVVRPWLDRIRAGEAICALALTEPEAGSDAAALRLRIRREGETYRLDGEKASISAADQAEIAIVFGRTGPLEARARGITALLVPLDRPGLKRHRTDCHGQRAVGRGSLFFDGVTVPVDHRLGAEGEGFVQVMQGFDYSRALIGLMVLGVARAALSETWRHLTEREAFGQKLAAFQGLTHPLADLDTKIEAARLLALQALWRKDQGLAHHLEAAMVKAWAPSLAYETVHRCLLAFGHGGYDRGVMEQRLRDVLGFEIGDGTAEIMRTLIARARAGREAVPY